MNNKFKKSIVSVAAVLAMVLQQTGGAVYALASDSTNLTQSSVVSASAASAKPVSSESTGLEVGQTIQGFTVKEIRKFAPLQADMILLEHEKTGAQFLYIANDDIDRSFTLQFRTLAEDEKGKPHVFEHATLSGSKKYPTDVFFPVSYQTFCSFANAKTFQKQTVYPIASLSEDQLIKYADYYTDACFHPNILSDKSIFDQEAWHYRLDKPDGKLTVEGIVYSEMLAGSNISSQALFSNYRAAFPGSISSNSAGGNPEHIPELTYEEIKAYHDKYYHPSNCVAFLYGKIDNFEQFAKLLNDEFKHYSKKSFSFDDPNYRPISNPVNHYEAYPVSENEDTTGKTIVYRDYILKDISNTSLKQMTILAELLSDSNSLLTRFITREYPQADVSVSILDEGPEKLLSVNVTGVEKKDAAKISAMIDAALIRISERGISKLTLEKAAHMLKAQKLLAGEGSSIGVGFSMNIGYYYANTGDLWFFTDTYNSYDNVEKYNSSGVYEKLLTKYVKNNYLRVLSVTYPKKGLLEKKEAAAEKALREKKASLSEDEINAIVEASNKSVDTEKNAELSAAIVAELKGVSLADLPEDLPSFELDDTTENNIRTVTAEADISDVGAAELMLDISDLSVEEAMWAKLYLSMMFFADSEKHSGSTLSYLKDISMLNANADLAVSISEDKKSFIPYICISWSALNENIDKSFDVILEVLTQTKTNQKYVIKGTADALRSNIYYTMASGDSSMLTRGGIDTPSGYGNYLYQTDYVNFYNFLGDVIKKLDSDPSEVINNLSAVREKISNSYGAAFGYAGDKAGIEKFKSASSKFASKLGSSPKKRAGFDKITINDAFIVNSGANHNYKLMSFEDLGITDLSESSMQELNVTAALITDAYMLPYLRMYYGAYGASAGVAINRGLGLSTYRDPNIAETSAVFEALADYLDSFEVDQETLDGYIMSTYSDIITPNGSLNAAFNAVDTKICDNCDYYAESAKALKTLKALTPERVNELKGYFAKLAREGKFYSVCTPSSYSANKKLFSDPIAPFSAG